MLLLLASINLSAAEFVDPVLAINKVLDVAEDYISKDAVSYTHLTLPTTLTV